MTLIRPKKSFIVTAMDNLAVVKHRWLVNAEDSRTALDIIKYIDIDKVDFDITESGSQPYFDGLIFSVWEFGGDTYQMF